jgi:hypothetical protein
VLQKTNVTSFMVIFCYIEYILLWTGFELTTLVVIGTDCTDSCKSNYHTIMTMTALWSYKSPMNIFGSKIHYLLSNPPLNFKVWRHSEKWDLMTFHIFLRSNPSITNWKRTNNDTQSNTMKTKDRMTRTPLRNGKQFLLH